MVYKKIGPKRENPLKANKAYISHDSKNIPTSIIDEPRNEKEEKGGFIDVKKEIIPKELEIKNKETENEIIDFIEIRENKNYVKIVMAKQKNRMVRLQIYLNGNEIRNSTFTGTTPAKCYWTLLKGILK